MLKELIYVLVIIIIRMMLLIEYFLVVYDNMIIVYWMINIIKLFCGWYFLLLFILGFWFLVIISWL